MSISASLHRLLPTFLCLTCGLGLRADVTLPALFSAHAVLQKSDNVPVWGKAAPGETITVTLDKATASATSDADGKWKTKLDLSAEGQGPFDMLVQGKNSISVPDVVVGEVWVCGGQSNMEFILKNAANAKDELAASANPMLRQFKVKMATSAVPVDDVIGSWVVAGPDTAAQFSAVAYFFGKKIQHELNVPVGLVNDCVGGTVIEAWTSSEALDTDSDLKAGKDKVQTARKAWDDYGTQYQAWLKQYTKGDHPADPKLFAGPEVDTKDWKPITLPGSFAAAGLPDAGAVWLRKKIPLPPDQLGHGIEMRLGDIRDFDKVFWNGLDIGGRDMTAIEQRFQTMAPASPGEATLAIRVYSPAGGGGIFSGADPKFVVGPVQLAGQWLAKSEVALPPLDADAKAALPQRPTVPLASMNVASYLFNGMINPVIPYAMQGVIWYQGEQNWGQGFQYRTALPLMINDWRTRWARGNFPFYLCQIAPFNGHDPKNPAHSWLAEVREAQTMALSVPNTGEAILIDIGEDKNVHPTDKVDVGDRLSGIALANIYGRKDVVFSGPTYDSITIEGDKARIHFKNTDGGLVAKTLPATYRPTSHSQATVPLVRTSPDGELEGFVICGADQQWKWATAKIDGTTVVASNPTVPVPVAVRYAWMNYPYCNLYNGAGLPAGPFRTDDFPLMSDKIRYPISP